MLDLLKSLFRPDWLSQYPLEKAIKKSASQLQGVLLDVGCGTKPYKKIFGHIKKYVGLDLENTPTRSQVIDVKADALSLPFANESFDSLLSTQTLEHVNNPQKMIWEMERVLKKSGKILLTAPLTWEIHDEPEDYFRFTCFGLTQLFKNANLRIVEIESLGGLWAAAGQTYLNAMSNTFGQKPILRYLFPFLYFGENLCFFLFDNLFKNNRNTPNYLVLAQKD